MDEANPPVVCAGDLEDAWVAAIAAALPPGTVRFPCAGDLPETWPAGLEQAAVLVLHRAVLTEGDAARLARVRQRGGFARVVLCIGPHARYHQVQRWATDLAAVVLPEAVAAEVVARHAGEAPRHRPPFASPPALRIVSDQHDFRAVWCEIGAAAGYAAGAVHDWSEVPAGGLVVWDVPMLEPSWAQRLTEHSPGRTVVALLGFADRAAVQATRAAGAAACLDSTCDPADLVWVLDRLATVGQVKRGFVE